MADDLQPRGFVRASEASRLSLVETTLTTWTSSKGLSVAHSLQVVRMITTSKDSFCDKSNALRF